MDRPLVVLHIEDSPSDRKLTAATIEESGLTVRLFQLERAEDGLAFLRRGAGCEECPRPDLVLLDLGLPGMNGREFLAEIAADASLRTVPVVVQTVADDDRTLIETLNLGALEFVAKPLQIEQLMAVVEYVTEFA